MSDSTVMTTKTELRKQLKTILKKLGSDEKTRQSEIITRKVLHNDKFRAAKSVSIYLNMDDEVQTEQLLHEIFRLGKECFIPRSIRGRTYDNDTVRDKYTGNEDYKHIIRFKFGNVEMEMLKLPNVKAYHDLPKNKWNIKQIPDDQVTESVFDKGELDVVLTPGLGFTLRGERIGRGKGYYDRFFERCRNELKSCPYLIGLSFNEQILSHLPVSDKDVLLDIVYTAEP